jgi:hypothetical protein
MMPDGKAMWVVHLLIAAALSFSFYLSSRDAVLLALYGKYAQGTVAAMPSEKAQVGVVQFSGIRYAGHFAPIMLPYPAPIGFNFDVVYLPNDPTVVAFAKRGDSPLLLLSRSVGFFASLLYGLGITYFFLKGLTGAREYFDSSGAAGSLPSPSVAKASDPVPSDMWSGDLSQMPGPGPAPPPPSIEYPGAVPLSLQPQANPAQAPASRRGPGARQGYMPLQPEERSAETESKDDAAKP